MAKKRMSNGGNLGKLPYNQVGQMSGQLVDEFANDPEEVNVGAEMGSSALKWAGSGAAIGSVIPGIGTAIGAGIGGLAGATKGFFSAQSQEEELQEKQDEIKRQQMINELGRERARNAQTSLQYKPVMQNGGDLLKEFEGPTHENGGIDINIAEVEGGETELDPMDYVFSDTLKNPNTGNTFAEDSKKIDKRYGKRLDSDAFTYRAKKKELTDLMSAQEKKKGNAKPKQKKQMGGSKTYGTPSQDSSRSATKFLDQNKEPVPYDLSDFDNFVAKSLWATRIKRKREAGEDPSDVILGDLSGDVGGIPSRPVRFKDLDRIPQEIIDKYNFDLARPDSSNNEMKDGGYKKKMQDGGFENISDIGMPMQVDPNTYPDDPILGDTDTVQGSDVNLSIPEISDNAEMYDIDGQSSQSSSLQAEDVLQYAPLAFSAGQTLVDAFSEPQSIDVPEIDQQYEVPLTDYRPYTQDVSESFQTAQEAVRRGARTPGQFLSGMGQLAVEEAQKRSDVMRNIRDINRQTLQQRQQFDFNVEQANRQAQLQQQQANLRAKAARRNAIRKGLAGLSTQAGQVAGDIRRQKAQERYNQRYLDLLDSLYSDVGYSGIQPQIDLE